MKGRSWGNSYEYREGLVRGFCFGQAVGCIVGIATCFCVLIATGSLR